MESITSYIKSAYQELMYKVTWPTFAELQNSAVVVLIASLVIAVFIWLMDLGSREVSTLLYDILMKIGG